MTNTRKSSACRQSGFSILEVMLVVFVIGFLAIIAIPRLPRLERRVAEHTAQKIVSEMRHARILAVANSQNYVLRFYPDVADEDGDGDVTEFTEYKIFAADSGGNPVDENDPVKTIDIEGDKVSCAAIGGSGFSSDIFFTSIGSVGSALTSPIIDVAGGGKTYEISVVIATGMATFAEV